MTSPPDLTQLSHTPGGGSPPYPQTRCPSGTGKSTLALSGAGDPIGGALAMAMATTIRWFVLLPCLHTLCTYALSAKEHAPHRRVGIGRAVRPQRPDLPALLILSRVILPRVPIIFFTDSTLTSWLSGSTQGFKMPCRASRPRLSPLLLSTPGFVLSSSLSRLCSLFHDSPLPFLGSRHTTLRTSRLFGWEFGWGVSLLCVIP